LQDLFGGHFLGPFVVLPGQDGAAEVEAD